MLKFSYFASGYPTYLFIAYPTDYYSGRVVVILIFFYVTLFLRSGAVVFNSEKRTSDFALSLRSLIYEGLVPCLVLYPKFFANSHSEVFFIFANVCFICRYMHLAGTVL
jgi:hypothetical protein